VVGTLEPRKGHSSVLDAADALWQDNKNFNLVFVGKQGWKVEALAKRLQEHPQLGQRLFWLQGISDEYLAKVYDHADCLVAASFGEGFGLPLIEAAQLNLPIIARDIPVFREVAQDFAYYFDSTEQTAVQCALSSWLELNDKGNAPQSVGMPWLSWKHSANQLITRIISKNNNFDKNPRCSTGI